MTEADLFKEIDLTLSALVLELMTLNHSVKRIEGTLNKIAEQKTTHNQARITTE